MVEPIIYNTRDSTTFHTTNMTLNEAKEMLVNNLAKGITCLCCGQYAKTYKRKITSSMAWALILIYNYYKEQGNLRNWLQVENYFKSLKDVPATVRGDFPKLRFWSLLEAEESEREDGSSRVGYYRITQKGINFTENRIRVSKHVFIYNNAPVAFSERQVGIRECLGSGFDYAELMRFKTFAGEVLLDVWLKQGMQFKDLGSGLFECSSDSGEVYQCRPLDAYCSCPANQFQVKVECKHLTELYKRIANHGKGIQNYGGKQDD